MSFRKEVTHYLIQVNEGNVTLKVDVIGVDEQTVDKMGRERSDGKGSREGKGCRERTRSRATCFHILIWKSYK